MREKPNTTIVSLNQANDGALVLAAKSGDEQAFGILVTRYQKKIFEAALRYARVRQDAEDIVQQAFQKAFIHLHSFEGKSSFCTWLTRIAINEALMILRKGRAFREVRLEEGSGDEDAPADKEISDSGPDPEALYLQKEDAETLFAAMNTLTPLVRTTIELRELAELSTQETATRLGLSVAAVKSRVFHGKAKLRRTLQCIGTNSKDPRRLIASGKENSATFNYHA